MLNCTLCDYYSINGGKKVCEFAGHLFIKNPADMEVYPCQDISYDSYMMRKENNEIETVIVA